MGVCGGTGVPERHGQDCVDPICLSTLTASVSLDPDTKRSGLIGAGVGAAESLGSLAMFSREFVGPVELCEHRGPLVLYCCLEPIAPARLRR